MSSNASPSAHEARQALYGIIREDATFEEKAERALDLGKRYLKADNGHLTHIDPEVDHWEARFSTDTTDGQFPPGLTLDLGITYCRRTIEAGVPIALHDVPNQGWDDDPAFEEHGVRCYHGTTLRVEDELYGTVCFVADDPREEVFSESETMFAELITRLLERELERAHHEAQLTRQTNLATVLNRVLRHNLRNDMSVIRGYTQMTKEMLDDGSYPEKALQNIDELLALSEKARELERIVGESFERQRTDIGNLVEQLAEQYNNEYPGASVSVEVDDDVETAVIPTFTRAIEELIENAVKHTGPTPTVEISVERIPNEIEIHIADDGPGLDKQERDVLSTGVETPLIHGSGLGLWIVHWIVTTHGGSVEANATTEGTAMTITVPHGPEYQTDEHVRELKRARDIYEAAFTDSLDAMLIFNDEARVVDANSTAEAIYGLERKQLLGRPIPEFLPDDFAFESAWEDFQRSGHTRGSVTVQGADGAERHVEYAATSDVVPGQHFMTVRESMNSSG